MLLDCIENNFREKRTVKEYANVLGISEKKIASCVIENCGITAYDLINKRILLEAKRMLFYTELGVNEIASQLGFEDSSNFIKIFKRNEGILPGDFRKINSNIPIPDNTILEEDNAS